MDKSDSTISESARGMLHYELCKTLQNFHAPARRAHQNMFPCQRVHFERLVFPWTDAALGNCSYLDTCRHMKTCRYIHYQLDDQPDAMTSENAGSAAKPKASVPNYLAVRTHSLLIHWSLRKTALCNLSFDSPSGTGSPDAVCSFQLDDDQADAITSEVLNLH